LRFVEPMRAQREVRHGGLGVHHRAVPFEDADAGIEERAIQRPRDRHGPSDVAALGQQQADVHTIERRMLQRRDVRTVRHEVRIGDPQPAARHRGDEQVRAQHRRAERFRVDEAQMHFTRRLDVRFGWDGRRIDGAARQAPAFGKAVLGVGDCGPDDFHSRVAPRVLLFLRPAHPHPADTQPGHECHAAVDADVLPMVSCRPAERRDEVAAD
jgi:hypothetical protein